MPIQSGKGSRLVSVVFVLLTVASSSFRAHAQSLRASVTVKVDPTKNLGQWEGWGSSLAWWARAIGGTANADYYADLIYTTKSTDGYPGLGLNIVRYNVSQGDFVRRPDAEQAQRLDQVRRAVGAPRREKAAS